MSSSQDTLEEQIVYKADDRMYAIACRFKKNGGQGKYIYCLEEEKFYFYDNGYWGALHELELIDRINEIIRINHLNISQQKHVIIHLSRILKSRLSEFNKHPLLNLENYMLDPVGVNVIAHEHKYYSTIRIPYRYDEFAQCPLWLDSLNGIFENDQDKIKMLQEFFGQCLTRDVKQEKALLLLGESRCGKSTILNTLQYMLGDKNCSSVPLKCFINPQFTSMMLNKLVNFDKDVSSKAVDFEEDFKKIVTGEEVSSNDKYVPPFSFRPFCKIVLSANKFPKITDYSSAFYNRLVLIPCNRIFKPEEQNRNLREQLLEELPGILNWSIKGLQRLIKRGHFEEIKFMREALDDLEGENNPINEFFKECIEAKVGDGIFLEKGEIYSKYVSWSKENNSGYVSRAKFSSCVFKKYHKFTPRDTNDPLTSRRIWRNIRFKQPIIPNIGWQNE